MSWHNHWWGYRNTTLPTIMGKSVPYNKVISVKNYPTNKQIMSLLLVTFLDKLLTDETIETCNDCRYRSVFSYFVTSNYRLKALLLERNVHILIVPCNSYLDFIQLRFFSINASDFIVLPPKALLASGLEAFHEDNICFGLQFNKDKGWESDMIAFYQNYIARIFPYSPAVGVIIFFSFKLCTWMCQPIWFICRNELEMKHRNFCFYS